MQGHTKLIPWTSDIVFENKERASERIFYFLYKNCFHKLMESANVLFFFVVFIAN